ncbi:MAG: hypothetical protein AAF416_03215 [Pseudomonadota bacterium]
MIFAVSIALMVGLGCFALQAAKAEVRQPVRIRVEEDPRKRDRRL